MLNNSSTLFLFSYGINHQLNIIIRTRLSTEISKAVNNVSLNIEKGQIYGLLGPNGAGKSTTLKMLTGMMKPTAGKIYFDGKLLDRKDLSKIGGIILGMLLGINYIEEISQNADKSKSPVCAEKRSFPLSFQADSPLG